jgi:hypothetical protein
MTTGMAVVVPLRHVPVRTAVIVFLERPARVAWKVEGSAIKSQSDQADKARLEWAFRFCEAKCATTIMTIKKANQEIF